MSDKTAIEWTDATWNPVTGCTKVTRGCDNCYAERIAERFRGTPGHPFEQGFDLTLRPERLSQPLSWKRPRKVFVNSMSDLFHKDIPADFIDSVFDTMEAADRHVFQVLTKRSSLMRDGTLVRWNYTDHTVSVYARHTAGYIRPDAGFSAPSHTEYDLIYRWTTPWDGRITVGVLNVTDEDPELDSFASPRPAVYSLYSLDGRIPYVSYRHFF